MITSSLAASRARMLEWTRRMLLDNDLFWGALQPFYEIVSAAPPAPWNRPLFTAVHLSYLRPQNIDLQCRLLLQCASIERVILCNHNPQIDIQEWLFLKDPRLTVIQESLPRGCNVRFQRMRESGAEHLLSIDDDLFLSPQQIEQLCAGTLAEPQRAHGFCGENDDGSHFIGLFENREESLDHLNRAYFLNRPLLERFFAITSSLGINDQSREWDESWFEDIVLSRCGSLKPRSHDIGWFLTCPTSTTPGIAAYKHPSFYPYRRELVNRLTRLGELPKPSLTDS